MNQRTDQQLINQTVSGDKEAYGELVRRYQDFIFTIVYRMVKIKEEAEEIAQDTFVKAYESLDSFRGDAKFSSWLYRIAYRKALDLIRARKRKNVYAEIEEISDHEIGGVENALETLMIEERNKIIKQSILQLADEEAAIVTFYYYESFSVKEIAELTDLSEDNVKIKLFRSRKKLFTLLKQHLLPEYKSHGTAI